MKPSAIHDSRKGRIAPHIGVQHCWYQATGEKPLEFDCIDEVGSRTEPLATAQLLQIISLELRNRSLHRASQTGIDTLHNLGGHARRSFYRSKLQRFGERQLVYPALNGGKNLSLLERRLLNLSAERIGGRKTLSMRFAIIVLRICTGG